MRKFLFSLLMIALFVPLGLAAKETTFVMEDYADVITANKDKNMTLQLNDDLELVTEGGNSAPTYNATKKYLQLAINAAFYIRGVSESVKITQISFAITSNTYQLSQGTYGTEPSSGAITYDKDTKTSTWIDTEGTNSVKFDLGGSTQFTSLTVQYTTGDDGVVAESRSITFTLADEKYGFDGKVDLVELSPLALNEDIQISFAGGNSHTYYQNGYANIYPNATMTINGSKDDVNITEIRFTVTKKSYNFADATCSPAGDFSYDEDLLQTIWKDDMGSNAVEFTLGFSSGRVTDITVTYSGGTAKGETTEPDEPDPDPETPVDDNLLSTGFDTAAEFAQFTVVNVQDGSNTWKHSTGNPYAKIENDMGGTVAKDDYLITPALPLKAGLSYRLTFDTWCGNPVYPEKVAAYLIQTTSDYANHETPVVPVTEVTNDNLIKRELSGTFNVTADGDYYIAFHASSDPGMHYLYIDNVEVSRGMTASSPGTVTDFIAAPSPLGETTVKLTFNTPTLCYDGVTPLTGLKQVIVKRDATVIAQLDATEGTALEVNDVVDKTGTYYYYVTAVAESGKSLDTRSAVYVGQAKPMSPTNLTVVETSPGTVELQWDAVTKNVYGHEVDPSLITYTIYDRPYWECKEGVTDNKVVIEYVTEGDFQKIATFSVKAKTGAMLSDNAATFPTMSVGNPFEMPFVEPFANSSVTITQPAEFIEDEKYPSAIWKPYETLTDAKIDPVTFDRGLLALLSNYDNTKSTFRTGKIKIDDNANNPYLSFYYFTSPGALNHFEVEINGTVIEDVTLDDERGWKEFMLPLTDYKGQNIRVGLIGYCVNSAEVIAIDNIEVSDRFDVDLAIARARIPYEMQHGVDHTCSVKVENKGVKDVDGYVLTIKNATETIKTFNGESLKRGQVAEHSFILTSNPDDAGNKMVYTVELEIAGDENNDDNIAEIEVSIPDHFLPAPAGLALNDKTLTWNSFVDDDFEIHTVTETFESYDEFVIDNAGAWSFYDGDAMPTFGLEDGYHTYPNMYEPMAFMVFNNHDDYFQGMGTMTFDVYDGGQCMISMAAKPADGSTVANNDWLISPELSGAAQTVSFYARSASKVFRESFKIAYTTADDPLATGSYMLVDSYVEIDNEWTEYTAALPVGAKYFAIVNVSTNQYMLFVDNVTYESAGNKVNVKGYDVYAAPEADAQQWTKVNSELLTEPSAVLSDELNAKFVRVHALFENGVETMSQPLDITTTNIETVIDNSAEQSNAVYYDLNGRRLSGKPTVGGVYVEMDSTGSRKVAITR